MTSSRQDLKNEASTLNNLNFTIKEGVAIMDDMEQFEENDSDYEDDFTDENERWKQYRIIMKRCLWM